MSRGIVQSVPARGQVLTPARGLVLPGGLGGLGGATATAAAGGEGALHRAAAGWRAWALLAALLLFGQTFQYLVDVLPAYALTKAWPLLMLPLAVWGARRLALPYAIILLLSIGWVMGVTPLIGVLELGNTIGGALASTAKVWALFSGFSCAAALVLLRARPKDLQRIVLGLGAATFLLMLVLALAVPRSAYDQGEGSTKLFLYDEQRGYRLYMPMFFGMLSIFVLNRWFWLRPRVWKPVAIAAGFVLLIAFFKQRTVIGGGVLVVVIGAALSAGRWRTPAVAALATAALLAAGPIWSYSHSDTLQKTLGGSLTTRQTEIAKALEFLNAAPHRWLIGSGSATRVGDVSLGDIVGTKAFFLADLGWLGVIFEYGAVGAFLLGLLHLAGLRITWRAAQIADPVARALFDYVLFIVLVSPILPVTFAPGELMTCMAMALCYLSLNPRGSDAEPPSPPWAPATAVGARA